MKAFYVSENKGKERLAFLVYANTAEEAIEKFLLRSGYPLSWVNRYGATEY